MRLRKHYFISILLCWVVLSSVTYAADTRIGIVNTAKLLKEAPQSEVAHKKLKNEFAPRDKKIVSLLKLIKKLEDKLLKDTAIISEAARKKQERAIVSKKRDVKRVREEFTEDFNFRRNEEISKLQKLVSETILSIAKEKKYDIILNESVIYASQKVDITASVLKRLREMHKQKIKKK